MKDAYSFDLDRGRRARCLQQDVRRLSAHLRAHGAEGDPDARPRPARSAATSATSSSSWPTPARARSSATATCSTWTCWPRASTTTSDLRAASSTDWTSIYAATDEKHDPAAFDAVPADQRVDGARHRGRPHLLFRHQVLGAAGRRGRRARTASRSPSQMGSYGIGVSRLVGAHHRGEPRRRRHHLAGQRSRPSRSA